jgi:hypothetical protein
MNRQRTSILALLFLAGVTACGDTEGPTQLVVTVDSDLDTPSQIDRVTVDVEGRASAKAASADLNDAPLPRSIGLVHDTGRLGPFIVKATGWLGSQRVVEKQVETSFVKGKTTELDIELERACQGHFCSEGFTCVAGACEPVAESSDADAGNVADVDAGRGDAGAMSRVDGGGAGGDGGGTGADASSGTGKPVCSIDLPEEGDAYQINRTVALRGSCTDGAGGALKTGLVWESDLSGAIGEGPSDSAKLTRAGTHTISLCAPAPEDGSMVGCVSVEVLLTTTPQPSGSIEPPEQGNSATQPFRQNINIALRGTGSGAGVRLSWSDNLQGDLGTGESVTLVKPVFGRHVVTLTITGRDDTEVRVTSEFVVVSAQQDSLVDDFAAVNAALDTAGNPAVFSLAADTNSRIYAGTAERGLYRFDGTNSAAAGAQAVGPLPDVVQDIFISRSKGLAYLATGAGLTVCSHTSGAGISSTCNTYATGDTSQDDMLSVIRMTGSDNVDYLLVGTKEGLAIADRVAGGQNGNSGFDAQWELTSQEIRGMAAAVTGGLVWLAASDGLYRYNPASETVTSMTKDGGPASSLTSVAVGTDGMVWVGSANGLGRYDPGEKEWTVWRATDGLVSNSIHAVAVHRVTVDGTDRDVIWIGTNAGVSRFDPTLDAFMNLTEADGLPADNVTDVVVLSNGTKIFATEVGVARYLGP